MPRRPSLLRRPTTWLACFVAAAAIAYSLWQAQGPRVPAVLVIRHDLEQHLVASGRVLPPATIEVAALLTGRVRSVGADEGEQVKAGQLLVQLDDDEARTELARAEAQVSEARARAAQVGSVAAVVASRTVEQAQANVDQALIQFERQRMLVASGAVARDQLDEAKRALSIARAQLGSAQTEQGAAGTAGVSARAANAALAQGLAQLSLAKLRLSQMQIVAPVDATVLSRDVEPGSVVSPAHTLLSLAASGATRLVIQPDERDLALIALGGRARASADAFPDAVFDAVVQYVAPSVQRERGTVDVRLSVPSPPAYLRPDMSVSVDLTVATRKAALVMPTEAVRGLATVKPWALAVVKGRTERRELRLGIRGEGSVEVLAGVREGDLLVVPDGQRVQPGDRVRPERMEP